MQADASDFRTSSKMNNYFSSTNDDDDPNLAPTKEIEPPPIDVSILKLEEISSDDDSDSESSDERIQLKLRKPSKAKKICHQIII